jgi:thiamine biosynthesis lipoprotein ApbE
VAFDPVLGQVRVPAGVVLDLGATAKALAADRAALTIEAELGCGVLVNLGGDIRVAGPRRRAAGGSASPTTPASTPGPAPKPGTWHRQRLLEQLFTDS